MKMNLWVWLSEGLGMMKIGNDDGSWEMSDEDEFFYEQIKRDKLRWWKWMNSEESLCLFINEFGPHDWEVNLY